MSGPVELKLPDPSAELKLPFMIDIAGHRVEIFLSDGKYCANLDNYFVSYSDFNLLLGHLFRHIFPRLEYAEREAKKLNAIRHALK